MTRNNKITTTSTNTLLSNKKEIPKRISTKEMDVKSYDLIIDDKKAPKIMTEEVTPFIRFIRDNTTFKIRIPDALFRGTTVGDRLFIYENKCLVIDITNRLCSYIEMNPPEKKSRQIC